MGCNLNLLWKAFHHIFNMIKTKTGYIFLLLLLLHASCNNFPTSAEVEIKDGSKPYMIHAILNKTHWRWGINIVENTLNDTAQIGIIQVAPGKTGRLFLTECFRDSLSFPYYPYKATNGKLVIRYFTLPL